MLSQYSLQYLVPLGTGHSHPGCAHLSHFFSAMTHLLAVDYHLPEAMADNPFAQGPEELVPAPRPLIKYQLVKPKRSQLPHREWPLSPSPTAPWVSQTSRGLSWHVHRID